MSAEAQVDLKKQAPVAEEKKEEQKGLSDEMWVESSAR